MKLDTLFPLSFSNSMLRDVYGCKLRWFRKYCQYLVNGEPKNHHLIAGGLFASGCEAVRIAFYDKKLSIDESIEIGYNLILDGEDTGDFNKSNEKMAYALRKYFQHFPLDSDKRPALLADGTHAIEYAFEIDLGIEHPDFPHRSITYKGKLDGLYEKVFQGRVLEKYVVDEKTTEALPRVKGTNVVDLIALENEYKTDAQFIGYHWVARALGVATDATLIYKVPILSKHEDAIELRIPINDFMIKQWEIGLRNEIHELIERYKYYKENESKLDFLPHFAFQPSFQSDCNNYKRRCSYSDGCLSEEGEASLANRMQQLVNLHEIGVIRTLAEHKKIIGEELEYDRL